MKFKALKTLRVLVGGVAGQIKNISMKKDKIKIKGVTYWHPHLSNISPKAKIGEGTVIHAFVSIHDEVVIGKHCKIEDGAKLFNGVFIDDDVFIGPEVCFTNDRNPAIRDGTFTPIATWVRKGATIGAGARLLAGIVIGEKAVIGMGAVVLEDIPNGELWAGVPARKIR